METQNGQTGEQQPNNITPPPPPIPPTIVNTPSNEEGSGNQGQEPQTPPQEPIRIIIEGDNSRDTHAMVANIIAGLALFFAILAFVYTYKLFGETQTANKTSSEALADQRTETRLQHISDRVKDSTDSAKYVRDTIAENKRDSANLANQDSLYKVQQTSVKAQIRSVSAQTEALKQAQKDFELENRPFVTVSEIAVDTSEKAKDLIVGFNIVNVGKFPAKILYVTIYAAVGIDTNKLDRKGKIEKLLQNEFIAGAASLTGKAYILKIDALNKYKIVRNLTNVYLFADIEYESFGIKSNYKSKIVLKINYTPEKNIFPVVNDPT